MISDKIGKYDFYGFGQKPNKFICPSCFNFSLILWDHNEKGSCKSCWITYTKEELLNKIKKICDLDYRFKVIEFGLSDPTFKPGGINRTNQEVQCPVCKHKFVQYVEEGCFWVHELPKTCPKCGFIRTFYVLKDILMGRYKW